MGNLIADRVKSVSLTKSQQRIAEYFIQNPERVGMSSSMEVAKAIGVSDASIIRFARVIGYEGFADLKADIYNDLATKATGGLNSLSLADRFDENKTKYGETTTTEDYKKVIQYNLERTFQQNSEERFQQAVNMLCQANHRYIIGFRGCLGVAGQCAWLLRILLDHVVCILDEGPGGVGCLQDIMPGDCAVIFSVSRYYKVDLKLAQLVKARGAELCLITNSVLSPLEELADVLLLAEIKHMSFFNSSIALNAISEYLMTKIAQSMPEIYRKRANERDLLTEDLRL